MKKSFLFAIVLACAAMVALLLFQHHRTSQTNAKPAGEMTKTDLPSPSLGGRPSAQAELATNVKPSVASAPGTDSFQDRILDLWRRHANPAEVAALLKKLYQADPRHLFETLLALSKTPLETRQTLVPLLANVMTLWPDAEGRDVFPIANAYGEMDLPAAAQWGATFLSATGRSDLNVADLLGHFAGTSEDQALAMIAALPDAARTAALQSAANYISTSDLNHLMAVCAQVDPNGSTQFSQLIFQRLAGTQLNATAAWLAGTPGADNLPGAAAAIAQGIVLSGNPQQAVTWADSLPDQTARGQAIASIYDQWNRSNPDTAIQNILSVYPEASQVLTGASQGTAGQSGSGLTTYWDAASNIQNSSARAYAIAALVEPTLLTSGMARTKADIAALPANSLEQSVAQITMQDVLNNARVSALLQNSGKP